MGTRSRIGMETANGAVYSIYCHWDGYPSHNGKLLLEHWSNDAKLRELMDLGDISVLAAELGRKHQFEGTRKPTWCKVYGRDRGETGIEAQVHDTREAFYAQAASGWEEYVYLWTQGEWLVSGANGNAGWALLVDVLASEIELA